MQSTDSLDQQFLKSQIENNQIAQNQITDQYFVGPESGTPTKMIIACEKCTIKTTLYSSIIFILFCCVFPLVFLSFWFIPLLIIVFILTIYVSYHYTRKKVEIERDESKNVISIKAFNLCGCSYKQLELSHFYFYIGIIYDDREK